MEKKLIKAEHTLLFSPREVGCTTSCSILLPGDWQGVAPVLPLDLPMTEHWDISVSVCVRHIA